MALIADVRQAETWTFSNILGGLVLLAALVIFLVWVIRRYLRD